MDVARRLQQRDETAMAELYDHLGRHVYQPVSKPPDSECGGIREGRLMFSVFA
jgi:hypothetical protein